MYLNNDGIDKLVKEYESDTKALREELFRFTWFMRGGVSVTESFLLTPEDREILNKIIESNIEIAKQNGIPFF